MTPTADIIVVKLLFNSVISTTGDKFMTIDISNVNLVTPLKRPEYTEINPKSIPGDAILEYNLGDIVMPNESVHVVANRGICGLP